MREEALIYNPYITVINQMLVDPYPVQVSPDAELFGFPLPCPLDDLNYKRHLAVGVHTYNDSGES